MAGELSALGAGLHSIGIPNNRIMEYERALKFDKFIVIAHGMLDDITMAILETAGAAQIAPGNGAQLRQRA